MDSSLSNSSPYSPLSHSCTHQVFPSFHGPDVRQAFLSHILKEFRRKGIEPFIDNNIKRGKSISPKLIEAIRGSKISIILLSRNYASSSWCLNELVEIMNCRKEFRQIVMPVFYKVDPTDVKKQTGYFGNVFRKTCEGKTSDDIRRWRHALVEVAQITGYHSSKWDSEADMIEKITDEISNQLNHSSPSNDFDCLIGMGAHIEMMERMLCLGSSEVKMIGIWGPSGIGKTTIAGCFFERHSNNYQLSVFMEDIKTFMYTSLATTCSNDRITKLKLQQHLMSRILNQKDIEVPHERVVRDRLKDRKVLIVLDDVHRSVILDAMARDIRWFGPGSRIIITTQDKRLLTAHGIEDIYNIPFPRFDEALQIFCMNAFGQDFPEDGFENLAWEVTRLTGKLPLGLKVMGSHFRRMPKDEWINELPRLRNHLNGDIMSILRFSYDALDNEEKDLFLHLACFFSGRPIEEVEALLVKRFPYVKRHLHILYDKSLIYERFLEIRMHDLLKQLGREIVRTQSIQERWFLFDGGEISDVRTRTTSSRNVLGINLELSEIDDQSIISERVFEDMCSLKFLRVHHGRFDRIDYDKVYLPQKLQLIEWVYFPMTCLPSNFQTEFLVKLHMPFSKLEKLWEGIQPLRNLKWMNLDHSKRLKELPDLSTATNLHELSFKYCSSLVELPYSIGNATNLRRLCLSHYSCLVDLSSSIGNATNLRVLDRSNCPMLVRLPSSIGNATNLRVLDLSKCSRLEELPFSIGNATNLQELSLRGCSSLVNLPPSIGNATNLQYLYLGDCSSLAELPSSIGNATNLQELSLRGCSSLVNLPFSIGDATNLRKLYLSHCSSLVDLPSSIGNFTNLQELELSDCSILEELPSSIGNATNLHKLDLRGCSSLVNLPSSIGNATNLRKLYLSHCSRLVNLPSSIGNFTNLQELELSDCSSLAELPSSIGNATNLQELSLRSCSSLVNLPFSIGNATNLRKLYLSHCSRLVNLPSSIGNFTNLQELELSDCSILEELPSSVGNATNLHKLDLRGCSSLVNLPSSIGNATNLRKLYLSHCSRLVDLPSSIGNFTNLQELELSDCSSLVELPSSIGNATTLQELSLRSCSSVVNLPFSIGNATNLRKLYLSHCSRLVDLPSSIGNFTNLQELELSDCSILEELPSSIGNATNLHKLDLRDCSSLVNLPSSIGNATNLRKLDLRGCSSLVNLPSSIGNAINLRKLYLSHCSRLVNLPSFIGNATYLRKLDLSDCSRLVELPSSIGNATNLQELYLNGCSKLVKLPSSIGNATNLQELYLKDCSSLVELPYFIGNLHKLSTMNLKGCSKVESLPTNINLESLRNLELNKCSRLKSFPEISTNIEFLWLRETAIEEVPSSIKTWFGLYHLQMSYNAKLKEYPHALESITELYFSDAEIKEVPLWVKGFSRLYGIVLNGCRKLVSLPQFPDSLEWLHAENCESLERLDCSFHHRKRHLNFANCFKLNNEARDLIVKAPQSDLYASCLPGREVPAHFTNRAVGGSVRVKLNESVLPTPLRFKACILLVNKVDDEARKSEYLSLSSSIMEKQNGFDVECKRSRHCLRPVLTHHLYIFELEAKTASSELLLEFPIDRHDEEWEIRECGVTMSLLDEEWETRECGVTMSYY